MHVMIHTRMVSSARSFVGSSGVVRVSPRRGVRLPPLLLRAGGLLPRAGRAVDVCLHGVDKGALTIVVRRINSDSIAFRLQPPPPRPPPSSPKTGS